MRDMSICVMNQWLKQSLFHQNSAISTMVNNRLIRHLLIQCPKGQPRSWHKEKHLLHQWKVIFKPAKHLQQKISSFLCQRMFYSRRKMRSLPLPAVRAYKLVKLGWVNPAPGPEWDGQETLEWLLKHWFIRKEEVGSWNVLSAQMFQLQGLKFTYN